jgi:hypothetical protein
MRAVTSWLHMVSLAFIMKLSFQNSQLTSSAFNPDKRPYSEFSWVVYSTKARFGDDATQAIVGQPAPVLAITANTGNHTELPDNRPPPNAPRGPRGGLHNPIPHPSYSSRPVQSGPAAPAGSRNNETLTPFQAVQTPTSRPPATNGLSTKQGKAPLRSGESSQTPDTIHPSRRPLINTTATPSATAKEHDSAQTYPDRARHVQAPAHHWPTPVSGPSKVPTTMAIRSSVPRRSASPARSTTYSPTPCPSSRTVRPSTRPSIKAKVPKTPGPAESQKQVASSELGTPSLHASGKHLPPVVVQTSTPTLSARAAGKQPARSAPSPVDTPVLSVSPAQATIQESLCKTCPEKHLGKCRPVCSTCSTRHRSGPDIRRCRPKCSKCGEHHSSRMGCPPLCSACSERHYGHVCNLSCTTCGRAHLGDCSAWGNTHAKNHSLPEDASNQDETPEPAEQNDATTSNIPSAETPKPEVASCKHSRRYKECVACECGCGTCHRPDKKCKKQRLEDEEKASKELETSDATLTADADDADDAAEMTESEDDSCKHGRRDEECIACECGCGKCRAPGKKCYKRKIEHREKKASKKRKTDEAIEADNADDVPDDADVMDVVEIADDEEMKVEKSASPSKPVPQPKKKRKKEAKKPKVKDTSGRWYNAIIVRD